ncbi:hypothetical protein DNHGIG_33010 [Collibacillus ludicampi]|uniref:HMA domain-containing protein n=1 Tax=Collibacillus ludicampi TaxID=2771369 RepID=A0AAV4LIU4_9BACL|nr:hypothetical protein DNHGIG_33010 [Collibacillus ludicampi]
MEGVSEATINFAIEQASFTYNPAKVGIPQIQQKFKSLGYDTVKETADLIILV